jgi:hypothetical protein
MPLQAIDGSAPIRTRLTGSMLSLRKFYLLYFPEWSRHNTSYSYPRHNNVTLNHSRPLFILLNPNLLDLLYFI